MALRALLPGLATILLVSFVFPTSLAQASLASGSSAPPAKLVSSPAGGAAGSSSSDANKQAQAATTAIDKAATAVAQASDATDKADKYEKAIQDITGSAAKSSQPALDNLQTLRATIDAINQNKVLNALTTAKEDLDKSKTGKPEFAVNDACSKLKQPAGGDQQDVTDAQAKCATAEKEADSALAAATKALTGLQSALQSISPYLANQFDVLAGTLKSFTDAKLISVGAATVAVTAKKTTTPPAKGTANAPPPKGTTNTTPAKGTTNTTPAKGTTNTTPAKGTTNTPPAKGNSPTPPAKKGTVASTPQTAVTTTIPKTNDPSTATQTATPSPGPSPTVLLQVLPKGLPALQQVLVSIGEYKAAWDAMKPTVESSSAGKTPAPSVAGASAPATSDKDKKDASSAKNASPDADVELQKLQDDIDGVQTNLAAWFAALSGQLQADSQKLDAEIPAVASDPAKNGAAALGDVRDETDTLAADQSIVDAWPPLVGFLADGQPSGFSLGTTRKNFEDLQKWTNILRASISRVHDALAGDFTDFETDQVSLYYFSDIPRLMYALNDRFQTMGGVTEAKAQADAQRTALTQTELDLADAEATVNRYQKQVLDLQEQQRQASAASNPATAVEGAVAGKTQNQNDSLSTKLATAQQSLSDAQTSVSQQRRKMLLAAQAESDAFAFARDNTPFLFAPADASSSDPAKRVILYAFNDSKTIFMRGKPDDVSVVKQMIAKFDTPAPQARLTLWTFQLSADSGQKTNNKAAGQLNESMEIVDQELGDTRALENTTLALLRDVINGAVARSTGPDDPNCKSAIPLTTDADCEKLRRIRFYDPLVLRQLKFDPADANDPDRLALLRKLIPDPADTTTLGEALLVLSLAKPETKDSIRSTFEEEVKNRLSKLPLKSTLWPPEGRADGPILPLTWHALGIWENGSAISGTGLSSSQLEIVRALRASYDNAVLYDTLNKIQSWSVELSGRSAPGVCPSVPPKCPEDPGLYSRLDDINEKIAAYVEQGKSALLKEKDAKAAKDAKELSALQADPNADKNETQELTAEAVKALPAADQVAYRDLDNEQLTLEGRLDTIKKRSAHVVTTLRGYGIDAGNLLASTAIPGSADQTRANIATLKQRILNYSGLSTASPRVAAADEMLKELIIAVEDDLAREFVQPMITELRTRLTTKKGVSVGIVQRESLLATNRGVARIDPRASAQLAVGDQEDILTGIQQLAQIYATVQTGGALAALGALQQLPREPQPEIYAINTGNKFQVTPVFDPSGQALRFKFDYVATANVQEPNGTTNTQLSRIERHTINTEVQLSNLETREISRFEVNARLGLPTTYWGGIPILKDIPYVRPWVPLVGWFVRKGGSNASAQQSVIFGLTTIYPTIGALIDLVSDPGSNP